MAAPKRRRKPKPIRPLGQVGTDAWNRMFTDDADWIEQSMDLELLQIVCEQIDERAALRFKVLRDGDWRERNALRALDQQILTGLSLLGLTPADRQRSGLESKANDNDDLSKFLAELSSPMVDPENVAPHPRWETRTN
jgi:hypothetical protein